MIFDTHYYNIEHKLEDLVPTQIEALQKQEIESLGIIYYKELKLLTSMFPFKLQITISPFLEISQLYMPTDYQAADVTLIVELGDKYPFKNPMFKLYSTNREVLKHPQILEIEASYPFNCDNPTQSFIIQEVVEKIREILLEKVKAELKSFKRIRHLMDEEISEEDEFYAETKWDHIENLRRKEVCTPFTTENFLQWNNRFMMEINRQDIEKKKREKNCDRPTGKEIFMNKTNLMFIEDGGNAEDDETENFDFKGAIKQANEAEVDVDADLFVDEDELPDEMLEEDS